MKSLIKYSKRLFISLLFLLGILIIAIFFSIPPSNDSSWRIVTPTLEGDLVFVNVNVIDVELGKTSYSQDVFVSSGRIQKIVSTGVLSYINYQLIDGENKYLSPGLIDSHVHLFEWQSLPRFLSSGVTTVRNMQGMPIHSRWKIAQRKWKLTGAKLISASPTINGNNNAGPFHQVVDNPSDAIELIKKYKKLNYDLIKVYSDLDKAVAKAILDTASELSIPVSGHIIRSLTLTEQSSQMISVEHIEDIYQTLLGNKYDAEKVKKIAKILIDSNTSVTTSLVAFENILQASKEGKEMLSNIPFTSMNSFMQFLGEKTMNEYFETKDNKWLRDKYSGMQKIVRYFDEAGVSLAMGTDTGPALTIPGYSVHEELKLLSDAGLSTKSILKTATIKGAELIGLSQSLGQVKVGFQADLLLLEDNPLDSIDTLRQPIAVMGNGKVFTGKELISLQELGLQHTSFYETVGGLIEHIANLK